MDFALQKRLYNSCDPDLSLATNDPRNVDLDAQQVLVRGERWVDRLVSRLRLSEGKELILFTGLPGSGKSTELRRLCDRLSQGEGKFLPVLIDAEQWLDLRSPIDVPDLLAMVVLCVEQAVLKEEGVDPLQAGKSSVFDRMWRWVRQASVTPSGVSVGAGGAQLMWELQAREELRTQVRKLAASELKEFLREVRETLGTLERRASRRGFHALFVAVDSLEKNRGITSTWDEVLRAAERLFGAHDSYVHLPVHVLYTLPPALVGRRIARVEFLPMLKVEDIERNPYEPGIGVARDIVRRRVRDSELREVFGEAYEARVREMILLSGGYIRDLIRLLRDMIEVAPVSETSFQRRMAELRDTYRRTITGADLGWLASVYVERTLRITNEEQRAAADRMVSNNVVLRYLNAKEWYDLHPAVRDDPELQRAISAHMKPGDGV